MQKWFGFLRLFCNRRNLFNNKILVKLDWIMMTHILQPNYGTRSKLIVCRTRTNLSQGSSIVYWYDIKTESINILNVHDIG